MDETAITTRNEIAETTPSRRRFVASALAALGVSLADIISPEELGAASQASSQAAPNFCSMQFQPFVPVVELVSDPKTGLNVDMTVKWAVKNAATIAGEEYKCQQMTL